MTPRNLKSWIYGKNFASKITISHRFYDFFWQIDVSLVFFRTYFQFLRTIGLQVEHRGNTCVPKKWDFYISAKIGSFSPNEVM